MNNSFKASPREQGITNGDHALESPPTETLKANPRVDRTRKGFPFFNKKKCKKFSKKKQKYEAIRLQHETISRLVQEMEDDRLKLDTPPPLEAEDFSSPPPALIGYDSDDENDEDELHPQSVRSSISDAFKAKDQLQEIMTTMDKFRDIINLASTSLEKHGRGSALDGLMSRFEDLLMFLMSLSQDTTMTQIILNITKYAKTLVKGSVLNLLLRRIGDIFTDTDKDDGFTQQAGWLTKNWESLVKGHFGKQVSSALNLLIAIGMMPEKADTLCTKEFYDVFELKAKKRQSKSIFEMLCNTVDFVAESMYPAIVKGDLSYLMDGKDRRDLDDLYRDTTLACLKHSSNRTRALEEDHKITDEAGLLVMLDKCIMAHVAFNKCSDPREREAINKKILTLDKLSNDLQSKWHDSNSRIKPFAVLIRGGSSVGKTTLIHTVNHLICSINGFPEGEEYTVFLNGDDSYQSEFTSHHVTTVFDDMCNTRPEHVTDNPLFKLIQFINNVHCAALSPIAEQKGKNDIRCKLVIVTTNTLDLHSAYFSCNPTSIMRRFKLIIDVSLKPECSNGTDGIKDEFAGLAMPDIWDLGFSTVGIVRGDALADTWHHVPQPGKDVVDLAYLLEKMSKQHFATQNEIVAASTNLHKQPHCEKHPLFVMPCPQCGKNKTVPTVITTAVETMPTLFEKKEEISMPTSGVSKPVPEGSWNEPFGKQVGTMESFLARFRRLENIMEEPVEEPLVYEDLDIMFPNEQEEEVNSYHSAHTTTPQMEVLSNSDVPSYASSSTISKLSSMSSGSKSRGFVKRFTGFFKTAVKKKKKPIEVDPEVQDALDAQEVLDNFTKLSQISQRQFKEKKGMLFRCIGENGFYWRQAVDEYSCTSELSAHDRFAVISKMATQRFESLVSLAKVGAKKLAELDPKYKALLALSAILATGGLMHKLQKTLNTQSAILADMQVTAMSPTMIVDHDDRYKKPITFSFPIPKASVSTLRTDFENHIDMNLRLASITEIDPVSRIELGKSFCLNACPLGNGDWVFPAHVFKPGKSYDVFMQNAPSAEIVKHVHFMANDANVYPMEASMDQCIVHIAGGGCNWKADKYLLASDYNISVGTLLEIYFQHPDNVYKGDRSKVPSLTKVQTKVTSVGYTNITGMGKVKRITYDFKQDTYQGLCGAVVTLAGRNPVIVGFHNAGRQHEGACTFTSKLQVDLIRKERDAEAPCMPIKVAEDGPLPKQMQGVDVSVEPTIHGRNPLNWMTSDTIHCADILGSTSSPTATFKTNVKESCIAKPLEEAMGIKKEHSGPDKAGASKARWEHVHNTTKDAPPVNPDTLKKAVTDFVMKYNSFSTQVDVSGNVHKLNLKDALNGVAGVQGFDPVNIDTSIGYPINKRKSEFLAIDEAIKEKYGSITKKCLREVVNADGSISLVASIEFDPDKYDLDKIMEDTLEYMVDGKRVYFCFRSNLKDEALPQEKVDEGKIRVFAGAPFPLVVVCRMLTLPAINMMKSFPDVFESAVGVDASGKDWNHLFKYVTKFGINNMVAGDFKKYDQTTPSAFTSTSLALLRMILKQSGNYSDVDLKIFDAMATEIISPLYEMNGVLYNTNKSVASGHPLTVILNGLNNILLMRYAYYANLEKYVPHKDCDPVKGNFPLFHKVVALITYGDDNLMSVSKDCLFFNHTTIAERLAEIGMTYTMADKSESSAEFLHIDACSFLKRRFAAHADLDGAIVAPLDIDSIHKSLTCTKHEKASQESEAQIMAGNMSSALYELFFHGTDVYEKYAEGFQQILDTRDSEGYRVGDYYQPPSLDDCAQRYHASTCHYEAVQELYPYFLQSQPFEQQAVPPPSDLRWYHDYRHVYIERYAVFLSSLRPLLLKSIFNMERVRRQKKRNARLAAELFEAAESGKELVVRPYFSSLLWSPSYTGTSRAYNCVQKLVMRRKLGIIKAFPEDIDEMIVRMSVTSAVERRMLEYYQGSDWVYWVASHP